MRFSSSFVSPLLFALVPFVSPLGNAAPAKAQAASELELVQATGACPPATAIAGALGEAQTLDLSGLVARADATTARTRVFCAVRLRLSVEPGLAAIVGAPQIKGTSQHAAGGSSDLSVRWYVTGQGGDHWLKKVATDGTGGDFAETPSDWQARTFGCGESPELNVLVDATARLHGDGTTPPDPAAFEAISVQQIVVPSVLYKRCDGAHP